MLIIAGAAYYFQSPAFREQSLSPLPIEVKIRRALTGPGQVIVIQNNSDRHLSLRATFKNPSLSQERAFRIDVAPHAQTEFGYREGWAFASGDLATFSHNDYKSWNGSLP